MKKTVYQAPDTEVVKLAYESALLDASYNDTTVITIDDNAGDDEPER
ncbi:MAG: hypothetical protein IJ588_14770 [Prevotella sp.]|nr:hypothetical protein [Prevotella sp.]MBR1449990.1 hypothetical protein [Prevotella sp.]